MRCKTAPPLEPLWGSQFHISTRVRLAHLFLPLKSVEMKKKRPRNEHQSEDEDESEDHGI